MMFAGRDYGTRMIRMLRDRFSRGVVVKRPVVKAPEPEVIKPAKTLYTPQRRTPLSRAPD